MAFWGPKVEVCRRSPRNSKLNHDHEIRKSVVGVITLTHTSDKAKDIAGRTTNRSDRVPHQTMKKDENEHVDYLSRRPRGSNERHIKLEYSRSRGTAGDEKPVAGAKSSTPMPTSPTEEPFDNLYVKNIAGGFDSEQEFINIFKKIGPIKSHKVEKDAKGDWAGYAFVCFENPRDAKKALDVLNNRPLRTGRKMHISKYESKYSRFKSGKGLPSLQMKKESSQLKLDPRAAPTRVFSNKQSLPQERKTPPPQHPAKLSNGLTKIEKYSTSEDTDKSSSSSDEDEKGDSENKPRQLYKIEQFSSEEEESDFESASSHASSPKPKSRKFTIPSEKKLFNNLYVKGFKDLLNNDADLHGAFKIFGKIVSVKWRGPDFGYVCFQNPKHAQAAMDALNGKAIGNGKCLTIARALTKDERQDEKDRNQNLGTGGGGSCEAEYLYAGSFAIPIPKGDPSCSICHKKNLKPMVILECRHIYCKPCLTKWLTMLIDDDELDDDGAIHCPERNCYEEFDINLVKVLVAKKTFNKYDRMLLFNLLETMDDIVKCPKCDCPTSIDLGCPTQLACCKKCGWSFVPNEI